MATAITRIDFSVTNAAVRAMLKRNAEGVPTGEVDLFVVLSGESDDFWISSDKMKQIQALADGSAAVMDSVDYDTKEVKKTKTVVRTGENFGFVVDGHPVALVSSNALKSFISLLEQPARELKSAEAARAAEAAALFKGTK